MGQANVKVTMDLTELQAARRLVKRVIAEAGEANRALAALEERVIGLNGELEEHGIRLEVQDS